MPFARASPANSCFQTSKPAEVLPHWAAWADGLRQASMAMVKKAAVVSPLRLVIRKSLAGRLTRRGILLQVAPKSRAAVTSATRSVFQSYFESFQAQENGRLSPAALFRWIAGSSPIKSGTGARA